VQRAFWRLVRQGLTYGAAGAAAGVGASLVKRWVRKGGGMPMVSLAEPSGRYLSMAEREEIACGLAAGDSLRAIAGRLGRAPSTISREIERNRGSGHSWRYRASAAQDRAERMAARPKPVGSRLINAM
jgi:transposase